MLFSITVIPVGGGDNICSAVTEVVQWFDDAGMSYEINGASTVIEGEWDDVMPLLKTAEASLRRQFDRVFLLITVDDHAGVDRLHGSPKKVEALLDHAIPLS